MCCFIRSSHRLPHLLPIPLPTKHQATTTTSSTAKIPSITGYCQFSCFPFRTWLWDATAEHTAYLSQRTWRNQTYLRGHCGRWGGRLWKPEETDGYNKVGFSGHSRAVVQKDGDDSILKTCASWSRRKPSTEEGAQSPPPGEALRQLINWSPLGEGELAFFEVVTSGRLTPSRVGRPHI